MNPVLELEESVNDVLAKRNPNFGGADIMAVTKYATLKQMEQLYACGQRLFGENKVQDALKKMDYFNSKGITDIKWHLIGHLQSNKAKKAVGAFECIQSIDSVKLLEAINEAAGKMGIVQKVYIQVNLANDEDKHGFDVADFLTQTNKYFTFPNCLVEGIMIIAPHTSISQVLRPFFKDARQFFEDVRGQFPQVKTLSMGMSSDYVLALEEGSNMVRIGSVLLESMT
ncbi:MAG: YggS family pyridoxal phosphate-dependent enzyme [bacterium]|nr:YggS family pyridoxal phosphate-dependent enzyme [bacterium]